MNPKWLVHAVEPSASVLYSPGRPESMVEPAQGCKVLLPDSEHMFDDGMAVTGFKSVVGLVTDAIEGRSSPLQGTGRR